MTEITKTEYYALAVDKIKNRIYFSITGFWGNPSVVPNYLRDIERASKEVVRGYTILSDLVKMRTMPPEAGKMHEQAQKILVDAGLAKTAEVLPQNVILKLQLQRHAESSKMTKKVFASKVEAEAWLDSR